MRPHPPLLSSTSAMAMALGPCIGVADGLWPWLLGPASASPMAYIVMAYVVMAMAMAMALGPASASPMAIDMAVAVLKNDGLGCELFQR